MPPALAALRDDRPLARVAGGDQMPRAGDEVGEAVGLVFELAVLVPAPALVRAAPHMRIGVNETAIDQRQRVRVETRR